MAKTLVAYFSATGTTAKLANTLSVALGADLYEIRPEAPYTAADLDWRDKESRTTLEMSDPSSRPAIADHDANIEAYDTIYVGFPVWWYIAPTIVNTFLEAYDLSGKKLVVFATSLGTKDLTNTVEHLRGSVAEDTVIVEGEVIDANASVEELAAWAEGLNG